MKKREIKYNEVGKEALEILSKGAFLTTKASDEVNSMTISWGNIGRMWNRPIFTVMVRKERHTYKLIEESNEFTVSIPYEDMKEAVAFLGSKSGRDMNKLEALNIKTVEGQVIDTPILDIKGIHYECKVVYKTEMTDKNLKEEIRDKWYGKESHHTIYFGEIVASYVIE
jgi:flavin reductase (DIM6/NTAB) family NADH-FMN oxidoreductase RutF